MNKLTKEDIDPRILEYIKELRQIQFDSGSKDEYGVGLYNGIEFVYACLNGSESEYLSYKDKKNEI